MLSRLGSKSINCVYASNKFNRLTNKVCIRHFSKTIDPKTVTNVADSSNTFITSSTANDATTTIVDPNSISNVANGLIENTAPLGLEALGWSPSHLAMSLIENIHLFTGCEYWMAITLSTLCLRGALLPLAISAQRSAGRLKLLKPHMDKLTAKMNTKTDNPEKIAEYQAEARALFKKYKVNPFLSFLVPLSQIPIFISFFYGMQSMGEFFPAMSSGGMMWFTDLTVPDASWGLPVLNGIIFAGMAEILVNENTGIGGDKKKQFLMKWGFRGLGVVMIPLLSHCTSGLMVYFITQGACSVAQGLVFMNPAMRKTIIAGSTMFIFLCVPPVDIYNVVWSHYTTINYAVLPFMESQPGIASYVSLRGI